VWLKILMADVTSHSGVLRNANGSSSHAETVVLREWWWWRRRRLLHLQSVWSRISKLRIRNRLALITPQLQNPIHRQGFFPFYKMSKLSLRPIQTPTWCTVRFWSVAWDSPLTSIQWRDKEHVEPYLQSPNVFMTLYSVTYKGSVLLHFSFSLNQ